MRASGNDLHLTSAARVLFGVCASVLCTRYNEGKYSGVVIIWMQIPNYEDVDRATFSERTLIGCLCPIYTRPTRDRHETDPVGWYPSMSSRLILSAHSFKGSVFTSLLTGGWSCCNASQTWPWSVPSTVTNVESEADPSGCHGGILCDM